MCGLLAIYRPGGVDPDQANRVLDLMTHRGPDAGALWLSDDRRLAIGHRRLKIIDLSDAANQPMISPDGRWVLAFNGEIVNYRDVRRLYCGDWQFRTSSDTEVLLATFVQRGAAAMHDWVGMFAFALLDREQGRLHLVRDRFGIKPLYWTRLADGGIASASEIPPLLKLLPRAVADEDTIRTYLETGLYDTGAHTFFAGVNALEPGCRAELDLATGELEVTRWYRLAEHVRDLSGIPEPELIEQGAALVEMAIRDHLVADVRVGLNVSGGVDSSVLVAVAKQSIGDLHVFTQDYEPPYSEAPWVRQVADGAQLHVCALKRADIEEVLDPTIRRQAEPFGGVSVAAYDFIYASASRENITVLLDGNGVDESFLGYTKYAQALSKQAFDWRGQSIDGSQAVAVDAIGARLVRGASVRNLRETDIGFSDPIKQLAALDLLATKIPRGLRFNDRMSMGRSRELRVPFLDHRLVEFAYGVPSRYLVNDNCTKLLFRKIAERWIPGAIANAPKRSVQTPQREWLADGWRGFVLDVLRSETLRERGWIDPARAGQIYQAYLDGDQANSFFIWQWLNLELWARAFLD